MAFHYEAVTGLFKQDDPNTDPTSFDYTHDFGLIASDGDNPWQAFAQHVAGLNASAPPGTDYRVLVLGRHGQGWHNVAETEVGTKAWDDHYSKLDSFDGHTLIDAHLTEVGREQARAAHRTWQKALAKGFPAPQSYYVSPLDRCLETCQITFTGLALPEDRPFKPMIKERVREVIGEHTCDKRSSKTAIRKRHPTFDIEDGFDEEDVLWKADWRETDADIDLRLRGFISELLATDRSEYISITAHSGAIASLLRVFGHQPFALQTGGVIPVVIKVVHS